MRPTLLGLGAGIATILAVSSAFSLESTQTMFSKAKFCSLPGVQMNCVLWEPANYNPATKYPLIVYMHGAGQSGWSANAAENITLIENTQNWASMLQKVVSEEAGTTNGEYLVMMPQAPNDNTAEGGSAYVLSAWGIKPSPSYSISLPPSPTMLHARSMVDGVRASHNVDGDRIYVIGASMGGFGAWDAAARYPDLFAATVPNAGGGAPDAASGLKNMAIWAHHGDADGAVAVNSDREMFQAVALAGGRPLYTETVGGDHTDGGVSGNPNFMTWILGQRRGVPAASNPALAFDPPGGALTSPVTITISSDQGSNIRYTLDGSVPSGSSPAYNGPITLTDSVVLMAMVDGGGERVFHAAPFQVDGKPLPPGAELVAGNPPPLPDPGTGSGGGSNAGTGGGSSAGTGGTPGMIGTTGGTGAVPGNPNPAAGGAPGSVPTGTASTPTPGAPTTPVPGAGTGAPSSRGTAKGSSCTVVTTGSNRDVGTTKLALFVAALAGLALIGRKRTRKGQARLN